MAGTINVNQLIPDPGQDLYINTGQYGANLVVGNATTQLLVVSPQGILSSGGTSALGVPSGTTAQRPANPVVGYIRFNTETQVLENYTANGWFKVSVQTPSISSISGNIYNGNTSILTITGTNFGATGANVTFTGANTASVTGLTPLGTTTILVPVPSAIYTIAAGSSVGVSVTNSDGVTSSVSSLTVVGLPTGGNTITSVGTTRVHTFNASGTLTVPTGFSATASYLIVAGGGGGASLGGGGGAGGMITGTTSISVGSYAFTVGSGGTGSPVGPTGQAPSGNPSSAFSFTATGGGGGGGYSSSNGVPGGSGGGGGYNGSGTGGSGTPGQGNPGGTGNVGAAFNAGGGGAGASGGSYPVPYGRNGDGGVGLSSSVTGSPVYYAGGGGGGCHTSFNGGLGGNGGTGGGGAGQPGSLSPAAIAGTTNTGGGGGAGGFSPSPGFQAGAAGGSGIVIVSYTL